MSDLIAGWGYSGSARKIALRVLDALKTKFDYTSLRSDPRSFHFDVLVEDGFVVRVTVEKIPPPIPFVSPKVSVSTSTPPLAAPSSPPRPLPGEEGRRP